jgi:hypothetical protein
MLLLIGAVADAQARTVTSLLVNVVSHPMVGAQAPTPRVVFDDERVLIEVELALVSIPDENPSAPPPAVTVQLVEPQWWRGLQWSLRDGKGSARSLRIDTARVVREDSGAVARAQRADRQHRLFLHAGERASVVLDLGFLPRGDYTITASLNDRTSANYTFAVRNGSESPEMHRAYLHYLMTQPQSLSRSREIILELASLEPQNASLFEDLGDMAVRNEQPDAADSAYRQAVAIVEENRIRLQRSGGSNAIIEKEFDRKLGQIAAVRRLVANYFANRTTFNFEVSIVGGRREYSLIRRDSGKVIERVR